MAKQVKDEHWLTEQLVRVLHWDADVARGVVGLISDAASEAEVQDIAAVYTDNNQEAISAIGAFRAAKQGVQQQQPQQRSAAPPQQQPRQAAPKAGSYASASATAAPTASAAQPSAVQQHTAPSDTAAAQDKWLSLGPGQPGPQETNPQALSKQQAEVTLAMFKRGGRINTKPAGGGGSSGSNNSSHKGEKLESIASKLERKVANCLSCGKIFDCRNITNDVIRFINSGYKCTYCGAAVAMTQQQRIQQAQQQQQRQAAGDDGHSSNSSAPAAADDAAAKAAAFKDRLLEYDRHSQQRTTVVDDQGDFFEIDTNAWLTDEERAELRRRARLEEEAAAARRNKVTVTLDLLGRKVVMAEGPGGGSSGAAGSGSGSGSGSSFELAGGSATQQLLQQVEAAAALEQDRQGGSTAGAKPVSRSGADKAASETLADALAAISNLRISAHPNLAATPVFMPRRKQPAEQQQQQQQQQPAGGHQGPKTTKKQRPRPKQGQEQQQAATVRRPAAQQQRPSAAASRAAAASSRVQDESMFEDFEAELLCDELLQKQHHVPAAVGGV